MTLLGRISDVSDVVMSNLIFQTSGNEFDSAYAAPKYAGYCASLICNAQYMPYWPRNGYPLKYSR